MKKIFLSLIGAYRYFLRPFLPPCCRFYPSCADYSLQAIDQHGLPHGLLLILVRLSRCHPLCSGGYDPVPVKQS